MGKKRPDISGYRKAIRESLAKIVGSEKLEILERPLKNAAPPASGGGDNGGTGQPAAQAGNGDEKKMSFFKKRMRGVVAIVMLLLIAVASVLICQKINFWAGIAFGVVVTVVFFYSAIREIPADPPHRAVLLVLRERKEIVLKEGWRFFPLWPIVFDAVPIDVSKTNQDLPEQLLRTPDKVEISVLVSVTWTPDKDSPKSLIQFLNSGSHEGVKNILHDIVRDRLRSWAFSTQEGPATWEEAMGSSDEAVAILLKAVLGEGLPKISSPIPTSILLKYFSDVPQKPSEYEVRITGENWEKLEAELKKLPPDGAEALKNQVSQRKRAVEKARQGNGYFEKPDLGIIINRFTINAIKLTGKVAEVTERRAIEVYERAAETLETQHVQARIQELTETLKISPEQALEIVQTERNKVAKAIRETRLNISPETRATIERILEKVVEKK